MNFNCGHHSTGTRLDKLWRVRNVQSRPGLEKEHIKKGLNETWEQRLRVIEKDPVEKKTNLDISRCLEKRVKHSKDNPRRVVVSFSP